jgi:hypothetical protein
MSRSTDLSPTKYEYEYDENALQDVFIMRPNGKIAYLPYAFYTAPSRVIESVPVAGEAQRFFLNEHGAYPFNLAGPAVSKVIDWNLVDEQGTYKRHPQDSTLTPATGYFVDLRRFSLDRQAMIFVCDEANYEDDQPISELIQFAADYQLVPVDKQDQLKAIPKDDNLYLVYFQYPNKTRSINQCYSYSVSYISVAELDACEFSQEQPSTKRTEEEIKTAAQHLETYYGDTKIQAGALHPMDFQSSPLPVICVTCYVANLRTFSS